MAVALFFCAYSTINFYAIQNPNHLKHFTQKEARIQNAASFIRYWCRKAIFAAPVLLGGKTAVSTSLFYLEHDHCKLNS